MKLCKRCGITKEDSKFSKNSHNDDGLQKWCKDCVREYTASRKDVVSEYHKQYRINHRDEISTQKKQYHKSRFEFVNSLKRPCEKCGENRLYVIQFHHRDPSEKLFTIGTLTKKSDELILDEVQKCVCLCANCHSEFHWIYGKNPKEPLIALNEYLGGDAIEI